MICVWYLQTELAVMCLLVAVCGRNLVSIKIPFNPLLCPPSPLCSTGVTLKILSHRLGHPQNLSDSFLD